MTLDKTLPLDQQIANQLQRQLDMNGAKMDRLEQIDSIEGRKTNSTHVADQLVAYSNENKYLTKLLNYQLNIIANKST